MNKEDIRLQVKRLKRHLLSAKNGDDIAFLDLAYSLRVISELKIQIDNLIKVSQLSISWPNMNKNNKIKTLLRDSRYIEVPLVSKKDNAQQGIQVKGLHIINRVLSEEEIKELYMAGLPGEKPTNLIFSQWLNSEVLYTTDNRNKRIGITREILIKRIANLLGGSHPSKNEGDSEEEKFFDPYIKELHSIHVANGYPLTYYQLIEIAEVIVERLDKVFLS